MLLPELRELLKKYKEEDLRLIIAEIYKSIPKSLRESKDIDVLLQDVHKYLQIEKVEKTKDRQIDVYNLKPKIELFIDYAYNQYYFAPNNFIHKKERPKWRFIVKSYINDLQSIPCEGEKGLIATNLLQKLYEMLSYACGYYIFNTNDPFRSVGIAQTKLLDTVITRKFASGINKESVRSAIELVIYSRVDMSTVRSSLTDVLIENLKTPDSKLIAIEQSMALKVELNKLIQNKSNKSRSSSSFDYEKKEKTNELVEMAVKLNLSLCEYEEAINCFSKNYIERNLEVSLFMLLSLLHEFNLKEYWLREYERAMQNEINPREALKKTYKYIQENDALPDCILY